MNRILFLVLAAGLAVSACDSGSTLEAAPSEANADGVLNANLEDIAAATAAVLGDEPTRQWVHAEAMKAFDGETNVLWKDLNASAARTSAARTAQTASSAPLWTAQVAAASRGGAPNARRGGAPNARTASAGDADAVREIEATLAAAAERRGGAMHLYWIDADEWDGTSGPLVGSLPVDQDPDEVVSIRAYDENGEVHIVEANAVWTRPVIVLAANERTNVDGELLADIMAPTSGANKSALLVDDDANHKGYFKMEWIRTLEDYEGRWSGGPEFRAAVTQYNGLNGSSSSLKQTLIYDYMSPKFRSECDNGEQCEVPDPYHFQWRPDMGFLSFHVQWYESDGNSSITFTTSGTFKVGGHQGAPGGEVTVGISVPLKKDDDILGSTMLHYDAWSPHTYTPGGPHQFKAYLTPGGPMPSGPTSS